MPTGGFVQGDIASMRATAEDGALAHLTSQSATRAYRCEGAPIRQEIVLEARGDSLLEWWPDPLIPYADTSLSQDLRLIVDERATLLVADSWLAGRVARGEVHQYARLHLATTATRPDGSLLFRDVLRLEPPAHALMESGVLGDARAIGSYFLVGPDLTARLETPLARLLGSTLSGRAAVSRLPGDAGLFVRVLAATSTDLRRVQAAILGACRERLFGKTAGHAYKP